MIEFFKRFLFSARVFKNYATTILGVVILIAYFGLLYSEKSSAAELAAVLTLAGTLIRAKDSLLGVKGHE